jgi:hypothetical protein
MHPTAVGACNALAEYPGSHVMEPPSSVSDQYRICVAGANAGMSTTEVLRNIATGLGAAAAIGALWYLRSQAQRPLPPPGTPTTQQDAEAPQPAPKPLRPQVQDLARALVANNPGLNQARADTTANQCLFLVGRTALNAKQECSSLPIFASGDDVPEATIHDLEALAFHYPWVRLNYEFGDTKPGAGWQTCPDMQAGQQCDEYPFFATMQGGPSAVPTPHLKPINGSQNMSQGGKYGAFSGTCLARQTGRPFLGIPLAPTLGIPTLALCNTPAP